MTNRKKGAATIPTFPPGYRPACRQTPKVTERAGVRCWLIRSAVDDRPVVVVDALDEDEALERAHLMRDALRTLDAWPKLPVVYAEEHGDGPTTITWFREGLFLALNDLQQPAK